ncbi:MAG: hypothetical protein RLZZ450_297 [Pseudomonadota bacterium]|jgi:hypothetical protein
MFGGGKDTATIWIESVYVFGSFARGAPLCGDLDLLMVFNHAEGPRPLERIVRAHFVARPAATDIVVASVSELAEKLERFPEAKPIWSFADREWRARVAQIPIDKSAGRFERRTDRLPLPLAQFDFHSLDHAHSVVDAIETGVLVSTWVPMESIVPQPEHWEEELQRISGIYHDRLGRRSREVLPFVIQWIHAELDTPAIGRWGSERACVHINAAFVHIGRPSLDVCLLYRADVSQLVLAPHLSRQYAPGLWILARGEQHPVVQLFSALRAWVSLEEGSHTVLLFLKDHLLHKYGVELFPTRRAAQELIDSTHDGDQADERVPARIDGRSLLDLVSKLEIVLVGDDELRVMGPASELAEALAQRLGLSGRVRPRRGGASE